LSSPASAQRAKLVQHFS